MGRGGEAHEIALALGHEQKFDVILIQEPYIFRERQRRITKRHPAYECFTSMDDWSTRPRVLTYLRKGKGYKAEQARPLQRKDPAQRDLLFLNISTPSGSPLTIINIYNAPPRSRGHGEAVRALSGMTHNTIGKCVFLAGDLNMHHDRWQTSHHGNNQPAEAFLDWADSMELSLISEPDAPKHARGNVLDLAFASEQLVSEGVSTETCTHMDVTSDHLPLLTLIPGEYQQSRQTGKLRPDTVEEGKFL